MRLNEIEIQKRRETIIHNAFLLFCKQGIEATKLSQIAAESHVSANTLYRYFGNKENLVLEAFIRLWDTIMSNVENIVEAAPDYASLSGFLQIKTWIEGFRHLYLSDSDFILFSYEAKLYLLRHGTHLDRFHQDTMMQSFRGPCLSALNKGKKDGSIPVDTDSEDLFYAIWGSIRGYVVKIVLYKDLYLEDSPWENRYQVVEQGILCALSAGWRVPGMDIKDID